MFSPDAPSHTHSLRPKRSRQTALDDSVKFPQAKRKRSAIRRDTFEPLSDASINEIAGRTNRDSPTTNGNGVRKEKEKATPALESRPLTLRGGKKADKRQEGNGGALTLSSNEFYNVTQLPALPDQIRSRPAVPYTSIISPEYGYALALTHTEALVWAYNSSSSTPATRDLLSFKLPFPPASATDPLPLAAFTAKTAAGEPGIVVISPKCGKIVYWETITNAFSFVPGQTSSGLQASIPGLQSGETVKEIVNAEPAGFIVTFSHGRVAHVTVRDQMGRPGIGLQFMRKSSPSGSLFGSIRNVFGVDRRKGTPIVRAGKSSKAQRDIVVGTETGELEFWDTNLAIGTTLNRVLSVKEDLLEALKHNLPADAIGGLHFKVLDFELVAGPSSGQSLMKKGSQEATPFSILTAITHQDETTYYIVELTVAGEFVIVQAVHPIKCYTSSLVESSNWRPRLCLPKPYQVAFLIFEAAVVSFSLARVEESPSSQLLLERNALPDPFQDCIRFQEDAIYRVLGYAMEEEDSHNRNPACVITVQGFGTVRFTSTMPKEESDDIEDPEMRISPKSKIEQAVFFGTIRQNPLDLSSRTTGQSFTDEEIAAAALEISSEILSSRSKYLPKSTSSIEAQMKLRAKAFEDLIYHLLKFYPSSLSRATRFQLLWNAEKLCAAQAIWKVQEEIQRQYVDIKDREHGTYLQFCLMALHESRQTWPEAAKGETDRVRHWLTYDPVYIYYLAAELVSCLDYLEELDVVDPATVLDYHCEGTDLWVAAYEASYRFTENNAPMYGLADEIFKEGVLQTGYPPSLSDGPWTCSEISRQFSRLFISKNCELLGEWLDAGLSKKKKKEMPVNMKTHKPYDVPSKHATSELARRLPTQVEFWTRLVNEDMIQVVYEVSQKEEDPSKQSQMINDFKEQYRDSLRDSINQISDYNMPGAIALAEKIADPGLLVTLNTEYIRQLLAEGAANPDQAIALNRKLLHVQQHTETYFDRFGNGWAFAHFSRMISDGDIGILLTEVQEAHDMKQPYLTWFFKKCLKFGKPVGKISWINDIVGEQNYSRAERTLESVATKEAVELWGKRTELSLAKLAGLAAQEAAEATDTVTTKSKKYKLTRFDNAMHLLDIQESLHLHVVSSIGPTIDAKAAQDVAMKDLAQRVVDKHPALKKLLKNGLDVLLDKQAMSPQQLIDVLTLIDPIEFPGLHEEDPKILGREFTLALKIVDYAPDDALGAAEKDAFRRLIWRRAMIRDDWLVLNETSLKDDRQVETEMMQSALYRTLVQVLERAYQNDTPTPTLYSPQQLLDGETFSSSLKSVYDQGQLGKLEKEMGTEQKKLEGFVERGRLEVHWQGLVETAERGVRERADEAGEDAMRGVVDEDL